jgi:hypothetical protein
MMRGQQNIKLYRMLLSFIACCNQLTHRGGGGGSGLLNAEKEIICGQVGALGEYQNAKFSNNFNICTFCVLFKFDV